MPNTIEEISTALDTLNAQEFQWFLSYYSKKYNISIHKTTYGQEGVQMKVEGSGATVAEAVERALANFPKNPLDGTRWKTERLAAPIEEATFTETEGES